MTNSVNNAK